VAGLLRRLITLSHIVPVNTLALSVAAMLTIALSLDFSSLTTLCAGEHGAGDRTCATLRLASGAVIVGMAGLTVLAVEAARSIGGASVFAVCFVPLSQRLVLPAWLRMLRADVNAAIPSLGGPSPWPGRMGRHPMLTLLLGIGLVLPLTAAIMALRAVRPNLGMAPQGSVSAGTIDTVRPRFPRIAITPISVIVQPTEGSMPDADNLFVLRQTEERIAAVPGVCSDHTVWEVVKGHLLAQADSFAGVGSHARGTGSATCDRAGAIIEIDLKPSADAALVGIIRSESAILTDDDSSLRVVGLDAGDVDLLASITGAVIPAATLVIIATIAVR
jgi:hypothetical protein